jgi:pre-mRNA-splicing helicase BRR2
MRALFEISLRKNWAQLSEQLLNLCKICEKRLWNSMTPLRQFAGMPNLDEIARKLEKKA